MPSDVCIMVFCVCNVVVVCQNFQETCLFLCVVFYNPIYSSQCVMSDGRKTDE